ncbi:general secretion pathway protein [Flagellimonas allohymeniacidonis]|uniref:General secretion pathway protein n=1 Tax=Flagellimonas allohymeniacidonis TaxID=2517819 RepID=A0A4V2HSP0_9FLAO|nr:general secretion pathway protein [Allomuricauda hymeniacidonis]TAI48480.1 general secretion pathway protein [Allomuricauda hymeniacidonis]
MIIFLKIMAMLCFGSICFQDFKERKVYWVIFPILGLLLCTLYFRVSSEPLVPFLNIVLNLLLVGAFLLLSYLYAKLILRRRFVDHSLGLGDILLFLTLALGFPTITFAILFVASLIFSLLAFLALKSKLKEATVPLAGLMGLFYATVLAYSIFFPNPSLYLY